MSENIFDYLRSTPYPGRGILLGGSPDAKNAVIAYFIMGRSENSRNRVFIEDGNDLRTKAFDPAKLSDPSLVIYRAVADCGKITIVTNGDQTDTAVDFMDSGKTFEDAMRTREFEPDGPNYTPRISGIVNEDGAYKLSILKCGGGNVCDRFFFEYGALRSGVGHFISTYKTAGDPLPSFAGEPIEVSLPYVGAAELASMLWNSLNEQNRVSLFVRYINLETGGSESAIINRHEETL